MTATHKCHAPGCAQPTEPRMLMCPACWALVKPAHQDEVWRHYRKGQERDKKPSRLWIAAACDAKADVMDAKGTGGEGYRAMARNIREAWA